MLKWLGCALVLMGIIMASTVEAAVYPLPANGDNVIGSDRVATAKVTDTISTFAERYDVGYYSVLEANPNVSPFRLYNGIRLFVPSQFILPDAPREGIVINLAELRLYYYPPGSNTVVTYPIGIGRIGEGWQTPTGQVPITEKIQDPVWRVPPSVVADMARRGKTIPETIPPGPENPLGAYMMRMGQTSFLIHGTNRSDTVGRRTSAGCIHLYPEDIEALYNAIPLGTPVTVVNQPLKVGVLNGQLYLEAHSPLLEQRAEYAGQYDTIARNTLQNALGKQTANVDWTKVQLLTQIQTGVPAVIGTATAPLLVTAANATTNSKTFADIMAAAELAAAAAAANPANPAALAANSGTGAAAAKTSGTLAAKTTKPETVAAAAANTTSAGG